MPGNRDKRATGHYRIRGRGKSRSQFTVEGPDGRAVCRAHGRYNAELVVACLQVVHDARMLTEQRRQESEVRDLWKGE